MKRSWICAYCNTRNIAFHQFCGKCGAEYSVNESAAEAHPWTNMQIAGAVCIGIMLLIAIGVISGIKHPPQPNQTYNPSFPTTTTSTPLPAPPLELLSKRGEREYDYITVEGQVKNITAEPLEHVQVVIECHTADGTFVKSAESLISYDPLLPGQTSPFKAMTTDNPAIKTYRVSFKTMWGGTLEYTNSVIKQSAKQKKRN